MNNLALGLIFIIIGLVFIMFLAEAPECGSIWEDFECHLDNLAMAPTRMLIWIIGAVFVIVGLSKMLSG